MLRRVQNGNMCSQLPSSRRVEDGSWRVEGAFSSVQFSSAFISALVAYLMHTGVEELSAVYVKKTPTTNPKPNKSKTTFFRNRHSFENLVKCVCPRLGIRNPFQKLLGLAFYILNPPPCYTYTASCEDRYRSLVRIRATSSWHEIPLNQQLTHSAFVSAFCFALWRVCYSSLIPS